MTRQLVITLDADTPRVDLTDALRFYVDHIATGGDLTSDLNTYDGHTIGHATTRDVASANTDGPARITITWAGSDHPRPFTDLTDTWPDTTTAWAALRAMLPETAADAPRAGYGTFTDTDSDTWTVTPAPCTDPDCITSGRHHLYDTHTTES